MKILTFSECSRHNVQHWHGSDQWFHVAMTLAADGVHDPLAAVPDVGEDGGPAAAGLLGGAVAPGAEHGLQLPHPRLQAHQRGAQVSLQCTQVVVTEY